MSTYIGSVGDGRSSARAVTKFGTPVEAQDRGLRGAADLSKMYGDVDYDRNAIENIYQKSVDDSAAMKAKEYARTAGQYYNRLGTLQNAVLDANRKGAGAALVSGATKGMQTAANLSSVLGLQQQSSADATMLAQGDRALVDEYAVAKSKATQDALTYANTQKLALGTLGSNVYATDAQKYVGELGANAQLGTAEISADAQLGTADRQLEGTKYSADMNYKGATEVASTNAGASKYAADAGLAGQKMSADAMIKSASTSAAAQRYAANAGITVQNMASTSQMISTALTANPNNISTALAAYNMMLNNPDGMTVIGTQFAGTANPAQMAQANTYK